MRVNRTGGGWMLEVYAWEANANSGKPLFCLKEKQASFTFHYTTMGNRDPLAPTFLGQPRRHDPGVVHDGSS